MENIDDPLAKSFLVPNAIDEIKFNKNISDEERKIIRKNLGLADDDCAVLFVGRISPEKGIKELLEAFDLIRDENIKLIVIGCVAFAMNTETKFSREIINKIKNMPNVKYIGYVVNYELYKYYKSCDLIIIPSTCEEASGLVSIEAMHSGLPIIATRSGGMTENLDENCAVILDKNNNLAENLAKNIKYLMSNKILMQKMSEASLKRAKLFTKRKYYYDFMRVFDIRN